MAEDTKQQKAILRTHKTAQKVRERFPAGMWVRARVGGMDGVVERHVPGTNAQGGVLVIRWDTGHVGRVSPITVMPLGFCQDCFRMRYIAEVREVKAKVPHGSCTQCVRERGERG
jgi:hypothetical protein